MYIKFRGDKRKLARLAILASVPGLEDLPIAKIYNPSWVKHWNFGGKTYTVNFFCPSDALVHPITGNLSRPWGVVYSTALHLVEAAGLGIVESMPLQKWYGKVLACSNPNGQES